MKAKQECEEDDIELLEPGEDAAEASKLAGRAVRSRCAGSVANSDAKGSVANPFLGDLIW